MATTMSPQSRSGSVGSGGTSLPLRTASRTRWRRAAPDRHVGEIGQGARHPHDVPDAADIGERDQERRFGFRAAQEAHRLGFGIGYRCRFRDSREPLLQMRISIGLQERDEARQIGACQTRSLYPAR